MYGPSFLVLAMTKYLTKGINGVLDHSLGYSPCCLWEFRRPDECGACLCSHYIHKANKQTKKGAKYPPTLEFWLSMFSPFYLGTQTPKLCTRDIQKLRKMAMSLPNPNIHQIYELLEHVKEKNKCTDPKQ